MSRTLLMLKPVPLVSFLPGGGGTFTRASEASYYTQPPNTTGNFLAWAANNVLRVNDMRDGIPGGALFEQSAINRCLWSEDLTNVVWTKTGCSISGSLVTAPDGAVDCNVVQFTASAAATCSQLIGGTADATTYVARFWVRKASPGNVRISYLLRDGTTAVTADKTVGTTWTLVEDSRSWGTGATPPSFAIQNDAAGTAQDVEVWGGHIVAAALQGLTSYIRTTSAVVTRSADLLTYTSVPLAMRSGRFTYRTSPVYSGVVSGSGTGYAIFAMSAALSTYVTGNGGCQAKINGVDQFAKVAGSFNANQILTQVVDLAAAVWTISGYTTNNGAGAAGTPTVFADGYLSVGSRATVTAFNGRIWEPYAA